MKARTLLTAWIAASLLGGALIAIPDDDARVFSISEGHGPAPLDLAGMTLVVAGFACFLAGAWRLRRAIPARAWRLAAVPYAAGIALTAWSVATDAGAWWVAGIGLATLAQGLVASWAWRRASAPPTAADPRGKKPADRPAILRRD